MKKGVGSEVGSVSGYICQRYGSGSAPKCHKSPTLHNRYGTGSVSAPWFAYLVIDRFHLWLWSKFYVRWTRGTAGVCVTCRGIPTCRSSSPPAGTLPSGSGSPPRSPRYGTLFFVSIWLNYLLSVGPECRVKPFQTPVTNFFAFTDQNLDTVRTRYCGWNCHYAKIIW